VRVATVCPYALSVPGGVQGQVISIASALAALGCEVAVVAPDDVDSRARGGLADDLARSGIVVVPAGRTVAVRANGSLAPVALSPVGVRGALRAVRAWRPDVVHVHEPLVPAVAISAVLARIAPAIGTFHRAGAGRLYRAARPLARACLARLDDVVAVSAAARDTLLAVAGAGASRCAIVPNGVATSRFEAAEPWPSSGPTVVFVGRHEPRKGVSVLLEALDSLPGSTRVWLVGDGPETASLRARFGADPRVEWCGRIDDGALARRLSGADVLVAPSLSGESFGVVLLEAMAAGTAVVASDLPGYRMAAGDAARYVPPGDALALGRALRVLLEDADARRSLVAAGRARAATCSVDQVARAYLARYEVLAGGGSGAT